MAPPPLPSPRLNFTSSLPPLKLSHLAKQRNIPFHWRKIRWRGRMDLPRQRGSLAGRSWSGLCDTMTPLWEITIPLHPKGEGEGEKKKKRTCMFGFEIQDKYTLCRVGLTKFGIEPSGESSVRPSGTSLPFTSRYLTPLMEHSRNCISFSVKVPVLSVNTYSTCQRKIGRFTYLVCGKKKKKVRHSRFHS